ncbi:putative sphinganine hydroxylase [Phaeomoniella chlamydospora]|uniref:Putative sphinganine hydroxylase n=1 Tax=Phaeomoniella chlamydospora TaxID=158046 RepID=A0A0G2E4I2_PHACM|nr:putative sphinganine hydroxylase [Phaeomoniella chlamydospora]
MSLFFHYVDEYDIWPQYRLHTPAELLQRNHATRYDVLKDVLLQQGVQTIFGLAMGYFDGPDMYGKEDYDVAVWAQRLRALQGGIPKVLGWVGLDTMTIGASLAKAHPILAGPLLGGHYPGLFESIITESGAVTVLPTFAEWELLTAKMIYYLIIPAVQFLVAVTWIDTWQYILHRAMHMNKFLYTTLHSRHHRLYVPYAFGALYNHPLEGFLLDTLGSGLAYLVAGMTTRQGMILFVGSTFKTVDDHCGYALPWDPFQHITSNNAAYHDIHHQSWGIKTNFSQPFFTFWDAILGTRWNGGDVTARYERAKLAAQRKYDADLAARDKGSLNAVAVPGTEDPARDTEEPFDYTNNIPTNGEPTLAERIRQEKEQENEARQIVTRSARKKSASTKSGDSLKGLRERVVGGSPHGGRATILHAEGGH